MKYNGLVKDVWEKDADVQTEIITTIMRDIRNAEYMTEYMLSLKPFFCPYNEYPVDIHGDYLYERGAMLYDNKLNCYGDGLLWLPIYDLWDDIAGFCWYSDGSIETEQNKAVNKYKMQVGAFVNYKYMNIRREELAKSIADGYICINDGFFDKYAISSLDMNSTSTFGSDFNDFRTGMLLPVRHWLVMQDNDNAGVDLGKRVMLLARKLGKRCTIVKHSCGKDMDDFLKHSENNRRYFKETIEWLVKENVHCQEFTLKPPKDL